MARLPKHGEFGLGPAGFDDVSSTEDIASLFLASTYTCTIQYLYINCIAIYYFSLYMVHCVCTRDS